MALSLKDIDLLKIRNSFPYWPSLLSGLIAILIIIGSTDEFFTKYVDSQTVRVIIYIALVFLWYLFWQLNRVFVRKNVKNKIGVVICIKTENDKQKVRLKNDFVKRMWELIDTHKLNDLINIVELNPFHTDKVYRILYDYSKLKESEKILQSKSAIIKRWKKLLKKTNGHFFLWGNIKERNDLVNKYIFDLDGRVIHAPIRSNIPNPLEKAFKEVWIKKIMFKESHELLGFQFTADISMLAVSYIIGIAAFVSLKPFSALTIHEGLIQDFKKFKPLPPNLQKVKNELLIYLSDECQVIARDYQHQGKGDDAWNYLKKALDYDPNNYDGLMLKSIFHFAIDNDPNESMKTCYQAKKVAKDNGTWKYNLAFLLMHLDKFVEALGWYEDIVKNSFEGEDEVLNQVYEFNDALLKTNPNHIQSHFIVGLLKYKKSVNYPQALEQLNLFINKSKVDIKYDILTRKAEKMMLEVERKMGLNKSLIY